MSGFSERGYAVFRNALPIAKLAVFRAAYQAEVGGPNRPMPRLDGEFAPLRALPDNVFITNAILNAHLASEPAAFLSAMMDILIGPEVSRCLRAVDPATSFVLHQSVLFLVNPMTITHNDTFCTDTSPPGRALTLWVPLEPFDIRLGPVYVVPWEQGRLLDDAELGVIPPAANDPRYVPEVQRLHHEALQRKLHAAEIELVTPVVNPGDLMLWASTTPHGSMTPRSAEKSRLSLQAIYRPHGVPFGAYRWEHGASRHAGPALPEEPSPNPAFYIRCAP